MLVPGLNRRLAIFVALSSSFDLDTSDFSIWANEAANQFHFSAEEEMRSLLTNGLPEYYALFMSADAEICITSASLKKRCYCIPIGARRILYSTNAIVP